MTQELEAARQAEVRREVVGQMCRTWDAEFSVAKFAVGQEHWHIFEIWRDEPSSEDPKEYLPQQGQSHQYPRLW